MTDNQTAPVSAIDPISATERYAPMDILRGVAIFGILVMNIYGFAMPFAAYSNPLVLGGTDPLNMGIWFFTHIFFDQKFLAIFSMLYGAGIAMLTERALQRGVKATGIFYRRSFWLLVIGFLHGQLLWFGDILFGYAATGMLMYLFRNRRPRTLIIIALLWLPVAPLLTYTGGIFMHKMQGQAVALEARQEAGETLTEEEQELLVGWGETASMMAPTEEDIAEDLEVYRGDYAGILEHRSPLVAMFQIQGLFFYILWRAGGLMLIGMALLKTGVLKGHATAGFYKKMMLFGYGLGLPIMVFSAWNMHAHGFEPLWMFQIGMTPNYFASILVGLGHIGLVFTLHKAGVFDALFRRFAAVGRMAFTNYLAHSLIMTSIFYGYGLGLYGDLPRATQMLFALALIAAQLVYSPWWLSRFRFGPAEWLWRSLTYWRRQPMRTAEGS